MLPALGLWFALQDAPMKLVLESSMTTGKHGEGAVARLRNAGDAPVTVLVDAHFHEVSCSLHDGTGAPVPAFDQRCLCGAGLPPDQARTTVLAPGGTVEVAWFRLVPSYVRASSGPSRWCA